MRRIAMILLIGTLGLGASGVCAEDAPATDTSKSTIDDLQLGTYWWGADVELEDLRGKVVLWETWGS